MTDKNIGQSLNPESQGGNLKKITVVKILALFVMNQDMDYMFYFLVDILHFVNLVA